MSQQFFLEAVCVCSGGRITYLVLILLAGFSNNSYQPHIYIPRVNHYIGPERFFLSILTINAKQCTLSKLAF